jgi:hypothetical protein
MLIVAKLVVIVVSLCVAFVLVLGGSAGSVVPDNAFQFNGSSQ